MKRATIAAWGVHFYTALGLPLAYLCLDALHRHDARAFFLWSAIACMIDATDGFLARRLRVKEVLPQFDGRRLDDIVDYIHFVALPLLAVPALDLVPSAWAPAIIGPLMASGYGFCQEQAKTDDAFVGFPSYWNIIVLYLYVLGASPIVTVVTLTILAALVFLPIHYIYPSRAPFLWWPTQILGWLWAVCVIALLLIRDDASAQTLAWVSLYFPVYYVVISAIHHRRVMRAATL